MTRTLSPPGVHPDALVHHLALIDEGATVGARTRVWAWAHVLPGAVVGDGCNLCDHTYVEDGVVLGDRVTVKCGVYLWDGVTAEDDVFIGPAAVFTNDLAPRSGRHLQEYEKTHLARGCSIGANATIIAGCRVGCYAMVGAGATVTRDVPDFGLVIGSPARLVGWVAKDGTRLALSEGGGAWHGGHLYHLSDGAVTTSTAPPPSESAPGAPAGL